MGSTTHTAALACAVPPIWQPAPPWHMNGKRHGAGVRGDCEITHVYTFILDPEPHNPSQELVSAGALICAALPIRPAPVRRHKQEAGSSPNACTALYSGCRLIFKTEIHASEHSSSLSNGTLSTGACACAVPPGLRPPMETKAKSGICRECLGNATLRQYLQIYRASESASTFQFVSEGAVSASAPTCAVPPGRRAHLRRQSRQVEFGTIVGAAPHCVWAVYVEMTYASRNFQQEHCQVTYPKTGFIGAAAEGQMLVSRQCRPHSCPVGMPLQD